MIPKIIHYIWFGGKDLPPLAQKCINSWKKHCPDYEIIRWDESNFDIHFNFFTEQAYANKKWAFVSDVVRLYVLAHYGGIYMDTDVELLGPIDSFLKYKAFSGFESKDRISTGIMACEKNFPLFKELLNDYNSINFDPNHLITNVTLITNKCLEKGLVLNNEFQIVDGFALFPYDFFCPKDCETLKIKITSNSIAIHHFAGSWVPKRNAFFAFKVKLHIIKLRLLGLLKK